MEEFEFGIFEILVINKKFNLINNIIVFSLGILEICVWTALIFAIKYPKALKFAKFLIRDGIENVVEILYIYDKRCKPIKQEINKYFSIIYIYNLLKFNPY